MTDENLGFPGGSEVKASAWNAGDLGNPRVGKIPWRTKWQPTPALLPGESHGGRSLVGYMRTYSIAQETLLSTVVT